MHLLQAGLILSLEQKKKKKKSGLAGVNLVTWKKHCSALWGDLLLELLPELGNSQDPRETCGNGSGLQHGEESLKGNDSDFFPQLDTTQAKNTNPGYYQGHSLIPLNVGNTIMSIFFPSPGYRHNKD